MNSNDKLDRMVEKAWVRFEAAMNIEEIGNKHSDETGNIPQDAWIDFARDIIAAQKLHWTVEGESEAIALLRRLKNARPLLLYGDAWIELIDEVLSKVPTPPADKQDGDDQVRAVLKRLRLRFHFMRSPADPHWQPTPGGPWIPDWRYELQLIESALFGTEIKAAENPTDTKPANEVAAAPAPSEAQAGVPEDVRREAERLDFVLANLAWIRTKRADSGLDTYWLETQDEDENFIRLSGPGFYRTAREAIDAAIAAQAAQEPTHD